MFMNSPNIFIEYATLMAAGVTAIGTIVLACLTYVLAKHTNRANEISSSPIVIVTMTPNMWGVIHIDLEVENVGEATAFNVEINYEPELIAWADREDRRVPYTKVSVLKPGQILRASLDRYERYADIEYIANVSWTRSPNSNKREEIQYTLTVKDIAEATYLGSRDATVQIAEQIKKLREDWKSIASGYKRLKSDVFTQENRDDETEARRQNIERQRARRGHTSVKNSDSSENSN